METSFGNTLKERGFTKKHTKSGGGLPGNRTGIAQQLKVMGDEW